MITPFEKIDLSFFAFDLTGASDKPLFSFLSSFVPQPTPSPSWSTSWAAPCRPPPHVPDSAPAALRPAPSESTDIGWKKRGHSGHARRDGDRSRADARHEWSLQAKQRILIYLISTQILLSFFINNLNLLIFNFEMITRKQTSWPSNKNNQLDYLNSEENEEETRER